MKKFLFITLVFLGLLALSLRFGIKPAYSLLGYQDRAGLKITSNPSSRVLLDSNAIGKTPFEEENLTSGSYNLKLDDEESTFESAINLTRGTITVIDHDFNQSNLLSSGEILTLVPGRGAVITSTPNGADLMVDGVSVGKTPISLSNVSTGEHEFILSLDHYQKKQIKATVLDNMRVVINIDLSIVPLDNSLDLNTPQITNYVQVIGTPNGFLRVRSSPSTSAIEVGKASDGDVLTLIDTESDWVKVKLDDGTVGYVSSDYIQKQ